MKSKIFKSGNSQAVRIPRELALPYGDGEVDIVRRGNTLVITPLGAPTGGQLFDALAAIEGPIERDQPPTQERDWDL